jgi:hypothetical protein
VELAGSVNRGVGLGQWIKHIGIDLCFDPLVFYSIRKKVDEKFHF